MVTLGKIDEPEFTLASYSPESSDTTDFDIDVRSLSQDADLASGSVNRTRNVLVESLDSDEGAVALSRTRTVLVGSADLDRTDSLSVERFRLLEPQSHEPEFTLASYSSESSDSTDFSLDVRSLSQDADRDETILIRTRALQTVSLDLDVSSAVLNRARTLQTVGLEEDRSVGLVLDRTRTVLTTGVDSERSVNQSLTRTRDLGIPNEDVLTLSSYEDDDSDGVNFELSTGFLSRDGESSDEIVTQRVRDIFGESFDSDLSSLDVDRARDVFGDSFDADVSRELSVTRKRDVFGVGEDRDSAQPSLDRVRDVFARSFDRDRSIGVSLDRNRLVVSSASDKERSFELVVVRERDVFGDATDRDSSSLVLERLRDVFVESQDSDQSIGELLREREIGVPNENEFVLDSYSEDDSDSVNIELAAGFLSRDRDESVELVVDRLRPLEIDADDADDGSFRLDRDFEIVLLRKITEEERKVVREDQLN